MKKIRLKKFSVDDWQLYKSIRLEALAAHPNFFCPSRDETQFTELDWKQRLENKDSCTFGLYCGDELIGLTGVVRDKEIMEKAHLVSSYIRKEFRKKNFSRLLYEARIKWAQEQQDIKYLVVDHNEENEPSRKAHKNFGFKYDSSYQEVSSCGTVKNIVSYKLNI